MSNIAILAVMVSAGYFTGRYYEKKHFKSLVEREKKYQHISVISGEWKDHIDPDDEGFAVSSGIVVASDYFKFFVSNLKSLFGGRLTTYESLLDRGRRESIIRCKEKAFEMGAHSIVNMRIETSTVNSSSKNKGALPCVELFAYGTALKKKPS